VNRSGIWTAREWWAAVCGVGLIVVLVACLNTYVGGPSQVNQQFTGGGSTPSPSPAGSSNVASVKIGEFGEKCPAGKEPAEAIARQLRVGCTSAITCTPKDAAGKEIPHEIPPHLDAFLAISGNQYVKVSESGEGGGFNLDVYGVDPGIAIFICKVAGVSSDAWPLEVTP